jgi:hypothetical protein
MSKGPVAPKSPHPATSPAPSPIHTTNHLSTHPPYSPILVDDASVESSGSAPAPQDAPVPIEISIPNTPPNVPASTTNTSATAKTTTQTDPQVYSLFNPQQGRSTKEHRIRKHNEINNTHVGDILSEKSDTTTRIFAQNQNGCNLRDKGYQFKEICEDTLLIQADLRAIIEHNLDTTNMDVRQTCYDIAKQTFPHFALEMTSSSIPFLTNYKPGGTTILTHDNITGRIMHKYSDPLGRWTHLQLAGKNNRILNFIAAYQVCPRPTHKTGTTAFHQQESLLRNQGRADFNPRRNFRKDITKFLQPMKQRNEHIILVGDFNEPLDAGNSNMAKICQDIGLADVFSIRHPHLHLRGQFARLRFIG